MFEFIVDKADHKRETQTVSVGAGKFHTSMGDKRSEYPT